MTKQVQHNLLDNENMFCLLVPWLSPVLLAQPVKYKCAVKAFICGYPALIQNVAKQHIKLTLCPRVQHYCYICSCTCLERFIVGYGSFRQPEI